MLLRTPVSARRYRASMFLLDWLYYAVKRINSFILRSTCADATAGAECVEPRIEAVDKTVDSQSLHRNQLVSRRRPVTLQCPLDTKSISSRPDGRNRRVHVAPQGVPQADRTWLALSGLRARPHRRQSHRLPRLVADTRRRGRLIARRQGVQTVSQRLLADVQQSVRAEHLSVRLRHIRVSRRNSAHDVKETVKSHFRATWAYLDGDDYVSVTLSYCKHQLLLRYHADGTKCITWRACLLPNFRWCSHCLSGRMARLS